MNFRHSMCNARQLRGDVWRVGQMPAKRATSFASSLFGSLFFGRDTAPKGQKGRAREFRLLEVGDELIQVSMKELCAHAAIPRRPSSVQSVVQCTSVCILPSCGRFFANLFLFVSAVPLRLRPPPPPPSRSTLSGDRPWRKQDRI